MKRGYGGGIFELMYIGGLLRCIAYVAATGVFQVPGWRVVAETKKPSRRSRWLVWISTGQWLLSKEAVPAPPNSPALIRLNQLCPLPLRR